MNEHILVFGDLVAGEQFICTHKGYVGVKCEKISGNLAEVCDTSALMIIEIDPITEVKEVPREDY